MANENSSKQRVLYLDVMRSLACIAVVLCHASAIYSLESTGSINFWIGNVFDSLCRFAVPFFVMISGALFLDERYQCTRKKLTGHIVRLVLFFLFWSVLYCLISDVVPQVMQHNPLSLEDVLTSIMVGPNQLWFIYLIVGLYLLVPLLRLWVKRANRRYVEYFIVLAFVFALLLPQISYTAQCLGVVNGPLETVLDYARLQYVGGYTAYFLLGWYLRNFDFRYKKIIYILGAASIAYELFATYALASATGGPVETYHPLTVNVFFQSLAAFFLVKALCERGVFATAKKGTCVLLSVSEHSLGIYAVHGGIVSLLMRLFKMCSMFQFPLLCIPLSFLVSLGASYLLSRIMKKIPLLERLA